MRPKTNVRKTSPYVFGKLLNFCSEDTQFFSLDGSITIIEQKKWFGWQVE